MFNVTECFPDGMSSCCQAVTNDVHTPRAPIFIEMFPHDHMPIAIGTNNGATRVGPLSCILMIWISITVNPPIPEPTLTPKRS